MSEYTSYTAVHVDNLEIVYDKLRRSSITSVLLPSDDHPLYLSNSPKEEWSLLPYNNKWLILMTEDGNSHDFDFLPLSINIVVDELSDRWFLGIYKKGVSVEFMFSDTPWGDVCAPDPQDDWDRIEKAKNISDSDLDFMEQTFQIKREKFVEYLRMGDGMVWAFLKTVGLPAAEMLCDWSFYFPEQGNGRCLLWNEYFKMVD